jgi:phosphoglycolate phosphatase
MPLLVLFDVDGTLFLTHDPLAGQAMRKTLSAKFGVVPPEDAVERVDHLGQTSLRIARLVLRDAGLGKAAIDDGLQGWCGSFGECYLELLADVDTSEWESAPGATTALSRLHAAGFQLALLTGNPEPVARARMKVLGLDGYFAEGQGAFGCESESRAQLVDLARRRADNRPATETVEVGDTLRDVESAHESGIRSIVVRSPRGSGERFRDADAVCDGLEGVSSQLLAWAG